MDLNASTDADVGAGNWIPDTDPYYCTYFLNQMQPKLN